LVVLKDKKGQEKQIIKKTTGTTINNKKRVV